MKSLSCLLENECRPGNNLLHPQQGEFFETLAAGIMVLFWWLRACMFSIGRIGMSMCTTGENCEKGPSKSRPLRGAHCVEPIAWSPLRAFAVVLQGSSTNFPIEVPLLPDENWCDPKSKTQ